MCLEDRPVTAWEELLFLPWFVKGIREEKFEAIDTQRLLTITDGYQ